MAYNADERRKALEPPTLIVDGETYIGVILSAVEMAPFRERFNQAFDKPEELTDKEAETLVREFCEAIEIPGDAVLGLPEPVMYEAVVDFLACQAGVSQSEASQTSTND